MIITIIRSKRAYSLLLGYFALFSGVQTQAAEIDTETPVAVSAVSAQDIRELPSISVDAIMPEDVRFAPGAATTLSDQELEQLRPYTLHDAFDFMPGVRTIDDDIMGRRAGIGIRGAPSRRSRKTLLLEDGTPINASTYLDPGAHYTPPMERIESIDVLKGAGHVLHGPLNNHGIVNFRNKRPTAVPETTIELSGGMNNTFKRHLMHRRTAGPLGMVFSYTGANADGVFDTEDTQYDDFFGSLDWNINSQHDLGVSLLYFRERSHYDESNLLPQEFKRNPFTKAKRLVDGSPTGFGQEFNTIAVDYLKADLDHHFQITDRLSMSNKLFATDLDRPRFTVNPGDICFDPASPDLDFICGGGTLFVRGVDGEMVGRHRIYRTYGAESRMELANIAALGLDHTFQWGVRYERHLLDDIRRGDADPGEVLDIDNKGAITRHVQYQGWATSVFLQDAMHFGHWTVIPGVRAEYYEQNRNRHRPAPFTNTKQSTFRSFFLPSISFLYDGFRDTQLFANVGRGYTPGFARVDDADNFPMEPETGINSQVGMRSSAIRGVTMEAAAFYNIISDTIVQLPFTTDGANIYINAADSESYGVDVGLRMDSNAFYTGSPFNLYGMLAYNYTRAEFTDDIVDGNRVPEIPLHAGSFTLGLDHTSGWDVSATLSHFGSFYTDPANTSSFTVTDEDGVILLPGNDLEIREPVVLGEVPSHTLLSARASYKMPGTDLTFWVQGRNLTDKVYIVDLENGIRPGAERTVVGGVHLQF